MFGIADLWNSRLELWSPHKGT